MLDPPLVVIDRGSGPVVRERGLRRHIGEPPPPVGELLLVAGAGQPAPVPDREVDLLDLEIRQRTRVTGEVRAVGSLPIQHDELVARPIIVQVLAGEPPLVFFGPESTHIVVHQRPDFRVVVLLAVGEVDEPRALLAVLGVEPTEVDARQRRVPAAVHDLLGALVRHAKRRAPDLLATLHLAQRLLPGGDVEFAVDP